MRKICFITGTRADFGIMSPIMRLVAESKDAELQIIATNMHLSDKFGKTVQEIEKDGFQVNFCINCLEDEDSAAETVRSMSRLLAGLSETLPILKPDLTVILGDRYEALASSLASVTLGIPVAHLHGGETTEGAMDDMFRHAITKLSTLHFAATPLYASRIIRMGEDPSRVFHSGAPGAEIANESSPDLYEKLLSIAGLSPQDKFILMAMHPVTMLPDRGLGEVNSVITALNGEIEAGYKILVTMPNSDPGNEGIINLLEIWERKNERKVKLVKSLGSSLFHEAMRHASAIVGNSSAALIEAPSLALPAVNIGFRQKGRANGATVVNVKAEIPEIKKALRNILSPEFHEFMIKLSLEERNPYYRKDAVKFIADKLINSYLPSSKPFVD